MASLVIKGHPSRGSEVIALLEMLGGNNIYKLTGNTDGVYYIIEGFEREIRIGEYIFGNEDICFFTLEQFEEKFPYKVGDKVSSKYLKNYEISKMEWESANNRVIYKLQGMGWYSADELQPYKEETMEEPKELLIDFIKDKDGNWVLNTHKDYEIKEVDGKFILLKKKPQYPETYEECCKILNMSRDYTCHNNVGYKWELITNFQKLLICRDAYWNIAGNQMGLGKPWKPDWSSSNSIKFILYICENEICTGIFLINNHILAFPTEEMRDTFYENFKELIESCKDLL